MPDWMEMPPPDEAEEPGMRRRATMERASAAYLAFILH